MRLAVAGTIYYALKDLKLTYPEVGEAQKKELLEAKKVLLAETD
jgi:hypothetical protein